MASLSSLKITTYAILLGADVLRFENLGITCRVKALAYKVYGKGLRNEITGFEHIPCDNCGVLILIRL